MLKQLQRLAILLVIGILFISIAYAQTMPEGPQDLNVTHSSRRTPHSVPSLEAYSGNVTHLTVYGETVTQTWQGYVGNVTGTITLDDSSNNTLYDWSLADPEGEIYATTIDGVDWTNGVMKCWNWSIPVESYLQLGELEGWDTEGVPAGTTGLGLASDDIDGVNETFSKPGETEFSSFYVGSKLIDGTTPNGDSACPVVNLYNESGEGGFEEVLLYHNHSTDDTKRSVVYTSILKEGANLGYDDSAWDFEMIVGEDGHDGDTSTTTYYFYVELE